MSVHNHTSLAPVNYTRKHPIERRSLAPIATFKDGVERALKPCLARIDVKKLLYIRAIEI
jgi:hypothetical protein